MLEEVGVHAARFGRVLVVTDAGVRAAGHVDALCAALEGAGVASSVWDGVEPDPSAAACQRACDAAPDAPAIVAIGGGACLDTAKAIALLRANPGPIDRYAGMGAARGPLCPLIAVPATAGTGSEAQSFCVVTRDADGAKVAVGHPDLRPGVSLLDPRIAATCPPRVAALAGLDALVHAVEASVSTASSAAARETALQALVALWDGLPAVVAGQAPLAAHEAMLVAAHRAGAAIEAGMLGAAHGTANALSACLGLPHGLAVATMLPAVLRFLGDSAGPPARALGFRDAATFAAAWEALLTDLNVGWAPVDVDVDALVAVARPQWTLRFSPRPVDDAALRGLFADALRTSADGAGRGR